MVTVIVVNIGPATHFFEERNKIFHEILFQPHVSFLANLSFKPLVNIVQLMLFIVKSKLVSLWRIQSRYMHLCVILRTISVEFNILINDLHVGFGFTFTIKSL